MSDEINPEGPGSRGRTGPARRARRRHQWVPTRDEVREAYVTSHYGESWEIYGPAFDRFIAAHDTDLRAEIAAEIRAAADIIDPSDDWPEGGIGDAYFVDGMRQATDIVLKGGKS